jgi:hypothetical protein
VCRKLVDDDAFEAQIAAHIATPLISGELSKLKRDRYWVGVFLRRALVRYLAIVLSRLLEKPGEGSTGVTASISSLLDMAKSEGVLDKRQIRHFTSEFKKIKCPRWLKRVSCVGLRPLAWMQTPMPKASTVN